MSLSIVNTRWPTCFKSLENPSLIEMFLTSSMYKVLGNDQVRPTSEFIHDIIYCSFKFDVLNSDNVRYISYRSFRNIDYEGLQRYSSSLNWNDIYHTPDVDNKVVLLNSLVNSLYDNYVPLITKRIKPSTCPWFNSQIKLLIEERECLF